MGRRHRPVRTERGADPGPLVPFPRDASLAAAPVAEQPRQAASASPTCCSSSTEPGLSSPCLSSSSRRCTVPGISPAGEDSPVSAGAVPGSPELSTATLTCRVPEHGTGVNIGPGQRLDHHGHAGDLVLRELLQGRLHTQTLSHRCPREAPRGRGTCAGSPAQPPPHKGQGEGWEAEFPVLVPPHLPQHHDHAVGPEEAAGVPLVQPHLCLHGKPGALPKILFCGR